MKLFMIYSILLCLLLLVSGGSELPAASSPTAIPTPTPTLTPTVACMHPQSFWQWGAAYCIPMSPETHVYVQPEHLICGQCYQIVRTAEMRMDQEHDFDQTGTCRYCDWKDVELTPEPFIPFTPTPSPNDP